MTIKRNLELDKPSVNALLVINQCYCRIHFRRRSNNYVRKICIERKETMTTSDLNK